MQSSLIAIIKNGQIQLPKASSLPEGTKVLIIPLPINQDQEDSESTNDNWEYFALQNLNQCYGETEPEYNLDSIKETNINYARS